VGCHVVGIGLWAVLWPWGSFQKQGRGYPLNSVMGRARGASSGGQLLLQSPRFETTLTPPENPIGCVPTGSKFQAARCLLWCAKQHEL
jgi:hypothetical protein